jgi:polar amino acid transport system substrate-binding protein
MKYKRNLVLLFIIIFIVKLKAFSIDNNSLKFAAVPFPPYSYIDEKTNEIKGIQVDIIKRMCVLSKINCSFSVIPFARAIKEIKRKDTNDLFVFDGIFNFYKNPDRLKEFKYSDKILNNPLVIFVRNDSKIKYSGKLSDLKSVSIGVMIGYSYSKELDEARNDKNNKNVVYNIEESTSHELNFKKLEAKHIDIYIVEKNVGKYVTKKLGIGNKFKILPKVFKQQDGFIGMSKENPKIFLLNELNKSLKILIKNGELNEIYSKYL